MSMMEAVQTVLSKYADFSGRARRREYWQFSLAMFIVFFGLYILALVPKIGFLFLVVAWLLGLAVLVPSIAVSVRRLQDTGKPWLYVLIGLIPFVGPLILLVFMVQDSTPGENEFGPNPKGA